MGSVLCCVVGMGIRVYIQNAIKGGAGTGEEPEESVDEGDSSDTAEFIRRSIVEGEVKGSQSGKPTEKGEDGRY